MTSQKPYIILVDDNPLDIHLTVTVLEHIENAPRIEILKDGLEVMEFLRRQSGGPNGQLPILILLDIKMPRLSGIEILSTLKADSCYRRVPVVMFTSSKSERDMFACYEHGASGYIIKPIDFQRYEETIRRTLDYWTRINSFPQTLWQT